MLSIQPIRAKLSIPRMPLDLVPRPRLLERLNAGLTRKLTLVCGPAGYGKTTLVCEWIQQLKIPCAWLTLDEGDDQLFAFLTYVVASLQRLYPNFGEKILPLLGATVLPLQPALVSALLNDLEALPEEVVMVFDDIHRVSQIAIYDLLDQVVTYLPPTVHLVLSTRNDPPLSLVTLRARGQLSEVRQRELRFNFAETHAFLVQSDGLTIDEATTAALEKRTDGWPVGLRLFMLSVQDNAGLDRLALGVGLEGTEVTGYLVDEVVRKQPQQMQEYLVQLAIVERFSLSLCMALFHPLPWQEVEDMLIHMQRENLFVTALGEGWYRYHPLMRELLLNRLKRKGEVEAVAGLHRRAALWYEDQGMVSEALYHLLCAPDESLAITLFTRFRLEAMNREQWPQLEHWLAYFPRQKVMDHPLLAMTQAWLYHIQFQLTKYMAIMQRVQWQLAEGKPPLDLATREVVEGEMYALASQAFYFQGEFQAAAENAQRSLELLPPTYSKARAVAYRILVLGRNHCGDYAGAHDALRRGLDEEPSHGDNFGPGLMSVKFFMGFLALDSVAMEESGAYMTKWAQERHLPESSLWAHYYLGWLAYTRNELEDAYQHFERVVLDRYVVHVGAVSSSYIVLALICQARAEEEKAREFVEEAIEFIRESPHPSALDATYAARVFLALLQGRTSEALAWAESQVDPPLLMPNVASTREAPLVLIKTLISDSADKSLSRAAALLPALLDVARTARAYLIIAELLALQARLCQKLGETEVALMHLTEAISLVHHSRSLRIFADLGLENSRGLLPLLEQLNQQNLAPDYLPKVLELLAPMRTIPATDKSLKQSGSGNFPALIEPLTAREGEVLILLAEGLTNRDIAAQLFLSTKTVENYTTSIYRKLDAKNRSQAAAKGRQLGIIPR